MIQCVDTLSFLAHVGSDREVTGSQAGSVAASDSSGGDGQPAGQDFRESSSNPNQSGLVENAVEASPAAGFQRHTPEGLAGTGRTVGDSQVEKSPRAWGCGHGGCQLTTPRSGAHRLQNDLSRRDAETKSRHIIRYGPVDSNDDRLRASLFEEVTNRVAEQAPRPQATEDAFEISERGDGNRLIDGSPPCPTHKRGHRSVDPDYVSGPRRQLFNKDTGRRSRHGRQPPTYRTAHVASRPKTK